MEKLEYLIYEAVDGRTRITLNRPGKRNALSIPLLEELNIALWEADNDKDVHSMVGPASTGPKFVMTRAN